MEVAGLAGIAEDIDLRKLESIPELAAVKQKEPEQKEPEQKEPDETSSTKSTSDSASVTAYEDVASTSKVEPINNQQDTSKVKVKMHEKYIKYFKMLSVGVPPPAIKIKMKSEKLNASLLDTPDAMIPIEDADEDEDEEEEEEEILFSSSDDNNDSDEFTD